MATVWTVRGSNPGGGKIFRTCPDRPWGPPSLLHNGYRVFPGGKERTGRDDDPSPLLVPWSRKSRAIPLLPLWAVGPVQSISACTRVHFTLLFTHRTYFCDVSVIGFASTPRCSKHSLQVFPPKPCMCCSSLPYVPQAPPISSSLI
jgi:hypothetical protein